MTRILLHDSFSQEGLDPLLQWMNPPAVWRVEHNAKQLLLHPDADTDFWQRTHYGFRADNGHFLYTGIAGDATLTAAVRCQPAHQYDQAGLMARFSDQCWLKASTEFEPDDPSHLGAVVTNAGYSDWSLQDFPYSHLQSDGALCYCLRLRREGADFLLEHAPALDGPWKLMRIARLDSLPGQMCRLGVYACSPKGSGCRVAFTSLRIELEER